MPAPGKQQVAAALRAIREMDDPVRLKRLMRNARAQGVAEVEDAAFLKLVEVLPQATEGPFAQDAWKSIHALEEMETRDRGKTVRLSRTRQKIGRDGVKKTLEDLAGRPSGTRGYDMLIDRDMPHLTFEAIVLKHPNSFDEAVLAAARSRLEGSGVDVERMLSTGEGAEHG